MKSDQEKYYFQDYTRLQHQCRAKTKPELPENPLQGATLSEKGRKFQNYLLTIAVNTCNNYTKKAKPLYMDLETLEDIEDTDNAFEKIGYEVKKIEDVK